MSRLTTTLATACILLAAVPALGNDAAVARKIVKHLQESGELKGFSIGVRYKDGTAWLRGRVASTEQMDTALEVANQVPEVKRVICKLEVGDEAGAGGEFQQQAPAPDHL